MDPTDDLLFDDRERLDPADVVGDAELSDARQKGFIGRPARSIMTDGDESTVRVTLDGVELEFREGSQQLIATAEDFDAALAKAVSAHGAVVVGDPLADLPFSVWHWPEADFAPPAALDLDSSADVGAIVMGGVPLFPAHPAKRTRRWVTVPGLQEYAALSADLKAWVRAPMEQAWAASDAVPDIGKAIGEVPFCTLRLLIASHPQVVPVKKVIRKGTDRGAVCYGVSRPYLTADLDDPAIYLPVISMKEGNTDAINAWDLDAGISLGPVQFNVINGHLFSALLTVAEEDPQLFRATFGSLRWQARTVDGRPALVVEQADGETVTLMSKRGEDRDGIRVNAGYFQAGKAGEWGLSKIDGEFRRDLAARFRNLVLWPHVQQWIMHESGSYLDRGRRKLDAADVPAVDPAHLDADRFTLRALLMSGYVRYGASLRYTLEKLDGLGSADAGTLLERLPKALDAVAGRSDAWADRIANLKRRYYGTSGKPGQVDHAKTVLAMRG